MVILLSTGVVRGFPINQNVLEDNFFQINKYRKPDERAQQATNNFDEFFRKCLQGKVIDGKEYETFCTFLYNMRQ